MFFQRARTKLFLGPKEETALVRVRGTLAAPRAVTSPLSGKDAGAFRYVLGVARPFADTRLLIDGLGFAPVLGGWIGNEIMLDIAGERLVVPLGATMLQTPFAGVAQVLERPLPVDVESAWQARRPRDGVVYFAEHPLTVDASFQVEGRIERARRDGYRQSASVHNESFRMVPDERVSLWELDAA